MESALAILIVLGGLGFIAYMLPGILAIARGHSSAVAVVALNVLVGWTFIGWVIALVWSLAGQPARR